MKIAAVLLLAACSADAPVEHGGPACVGGETRCLGGTFYLCTGGELHPEPACTACNEHLGGCSSCVPGTSVCRDGWSFVCNPNGSGFDAWYCDPVQGTGCDIDSGRCVGACAPQGLGQSYIGCDYYPTITANVVNSDFQYAVAIANTTDQPAQITIEWGALDEPDVFQVAPSSVEVRRLPWLWDLKGCEDPGAILGCFVVPVPALVSKGAYHLRSTQPVTVYQFSPLDYQLGSEFSYTNDASLLIPANAWGTDFVAAAWGSLQVVGAHTDQPTPGLLAVTAQRDGTQVTINTRARTMPGKRVGGMEPNSPQTVIMNQGDVLQVFSADGDITGTRVTSTEPVQVIAGHFCADVPVGVQWCDHLEETMFPVRALGAKYVIDPPALPSMPNGKPQVIRIVAAQDDTDLSFEPPQAAATHLDHAGDVIQMVGNAETFVLTATHRVLVAQYMEGQQAGGGAGDPAMTLAVPVDQFRRRYLFHAPTNYETNYVEVVAPQGSAITLDGAPVGGFASIGTTNLALARVQLDNGGNGNHAMEGDQPFGIQVYGYGQYTSYWYPGGLDLSTIVVP